MTNTQELQHEQRATPVNAASSGMAHGVLSALVGHWTTEGHQHKGIVGPDAAIVAEESYEWLTGQQFLVHRFDGHVGDAVATCIELIGYDAETDTYPTHTYYNTGVVNEWRATAHDSVWTLTGEWKMGRTIQVRCTTTISDDHSTLSGRWEWSDASTGWQTFWDVTSRKAGR